MGMLLMPANMPAEAHCQEDRGINAKDWLRTFGIVNLNLKVQTGGSMGDGILRQGGSIS